MNNHNAVATNDNTTITTTITTVYVKYQRFYSSFFKKNKTSQTLLGTGFGNSFCENRKINRNWPPVAIRYPKHGSSTY